MKEKYSKLQAISSDELINMKEKFEFHLMITENQSSRRGKGFAPREVRKNIVRINQILKERAEDKL